MNYALTIEINLPYAEARPKVKGALAEQGLGIRTEIDLQATLREETGAEVEQYVILGACNPQLAHQALEVERQIGLLLPRNVVVRASAGGTIVEALVPEIRRDPRRDGLTASSGTGQVTRRRLSFRSRLAALALATITSHDAHNEKRRSPAMMWWNRGCERTWIASPRQRLAGCVLGGDELCTRRSAREHRS